MSAEEDRQPKVHPPDPQSSIGPWSAAGEDGIGVRAWIRSKLGPPLDATERISRASVVVAAFSMLATVGSTAKELWVAKWYGRGDALDAFLIAFIVPLTIVRVVAGSLDSALVPALTRLSETRGRDEAQRLFSRAMFWALALLAGCSLLAWLLSPWYLPLLGSGFGPAKLRFTIHLQSALTPYIIAGGLVAIWAGVLGSLERFALPAFTPLVTPLIVIVLVTMAARTLGAEALVLGTVAGSLLEAVILGWALRDSGVPLRPAWPGIDPQLRGVIGQHFPMMAATLLMAGTAVVDQGMAAMLDRGSVAALNFGNKPAGAICGIVGGALHLAILPYFSQMVARRDWAGGRQTLRTYVRLTFLVTLPLTLGLVLFSRPIVRILFERGAFTPADTDIVCGIQSLYALQIPFFVLSVPFARAISALGGNQMLMFGAALALVLDVILNLTFIRFFGIVGIALSTSLVQLLSCAFMAFMATRMLRRASRAL